MLQPIEKKMLDILGATAHGHAASAVTAEEWAAVTAELTAQTVSSLPAAKIGSLGLSHEDSNAFLAALGKNVATFYRVAEAHAALFSLLGEAGIPAVVLKGMGAAMNYPHPEYRAMGDIDIIVPRADFERTCTLLTENAYRPLSDPEFFRRHLPFRAPDGTEVEVHRYFSSSDNEEQNEVLDAFVFSALGRVQTAAVCGYEIPVLPPLENGLVLLAHINQHLFTGLGLRQITDWMFYAEKYLTDDFWNGEFAPAAEKIGLRQLALVTTRMCRKYLAMEPQTEISWCGAPDADGGDSAGIEDELMEYILNHGNFGRKDKKKAKTVSMVRNMRNPIRFLKIAQENGCQTWELYHRHRWLRPFAWIYQLFRWLSHAVRDKITPKYLTEKAALEADETEFLTRLGVTRLHAKK